MVRERCSGRGEPPPVDRAGGQVLSREAQQREEGVVRLDDRPVGSLHHHADDVRLDQPAGPCRHLPLDVEEPEAFVRLREEARDGEQERDLVGLERSRRTELQAETPDRVIADDQGEHDQRLETEVLQGLGTEGEALQHGRPGR